MRRIDAINWAMKVVQKFEETRPEAWAHLRCSSILFCEDMRRVLSLKWGNNKAELWEHPNPLRWVLIVSKGEVSYVWDSDYKRAVLEEAEIAQRL